MTDIDAIHIGDIVRIKERIELMPLDDNVPAEIPAGIFGQVVEVRGHDGHLALYQVDFHSPYEYVNEISLREDLLEVVFRLN